MTSRCLHCNHLTNRTRLRGLCDVCHKTPQIRQLYPIRGPGKLTPDLARQVRLDRQHFDREEVAAMYGVTERTIYDIERGRYYKGV